VGAPRPVLQATDLGKRYRVYDRPQDRLKDLLWSRRPRHRHEMWALRDVSFQLAAGERLGVIGRNGSGKSTLLKLIAGTLAPTAGELKLAGRVAALIELGSGFHPEFTGRENARINAAILGLPPAQVEARLEEIVAFADIGEFIDQPVKLYSSGMLVRVAFAVTTAVDADILLVDEALAVGDVFFQQKCYRRLEALREQSVAVVLVSHAMHEVEQFCDRALLLDQGRLVFLGPAAEAVRRYYLIGQRLEAAATAASMPGSALSTPAAPADGSWSWPDERALSRVTNERQVSNGWALCTAVGLCDAEGGTREAFRFGETASIYSEFELTRDIDVPVGGAHIFNARAVLVHGRNTLQQDCEVPRRVPAGARVRFRYDVRLDLEPGDYTFEVGLATIDAASYDRRGRCSEEELHAAVVRICHLAAAGRFTVLRGPRLPHYGVTHLPGRYRAAITAANGAA
jgi:lipopolysaccharide transport system ATP-binding protein